MKRDYTDLGNGAPAMPMVDLYISEFEQNDFQGPIQAILDTGADVSCLPRGSVLKFVGDIFYERTTVAGIGGASYGSKSYLLDLKIGNCTIRQIDVVEISNDTALIGRDVLNNYCIYYDGPRAYLEVRSKQCKSNGRGS